MSETKAAIGGDVYRSSSCHVCIAILIEQDESWLISSQNFMDQLLVFKIFIAFHEACSDFP